MKKPLVSILMGIYNCATTLSEAVESILNQTYTNWELILCDDGSGDDTYLIAQAYRDRYPEKIFLLRNENNMGLNHTLNSCLGVAKGEYIARMDGDDISLPERLFKEVAFLESNKDISLVSTPMIYFDENGDWGKGTAISYPKLKDFVFHAPCFCHAPCMIRREAILAVNGYTVDKRLLRFEDCNLWYKLYAAGFLGANLDEYLYKMRDDRCAQKRRTVATRLRAVYVQWQGFRLVKMKWYYYPVLVKDFVKGIILAVMPAKIYTKLHRAKLSN